MKLAKIEVGNILTLRELNSDRIIKEKVTKVENPLIEDSYFQIRTENLDFDFQNFYEIIEFN